MVFVKKKEVKYPIENTRIWQEKTTNKTQSKSWQVEDWDSIAISDIYRNADMIRLFLT